MALGAKSSRAVARVDYIKRRNMEEMIARLNALKGKYTFEATGVGDYVCAVFGGRKVATMRFVDKEVIMFGGEALRDVASFLRGNNISVVI